MAVFVLRNVTITIDGVDLSDHVQSVGVAMSAADVNVTAMGAGGQQHAAGIRDDSMTLTMFSDFASSKVHATINPKFAAAGTVQVVVFPNTSTVSATNPSFTAFCPVLTYNPVSGAVGEAAMTPITLPVNGTITVATS